MLFRSYQLASTRTSNSSSLHETDFAVAALRPLTPQQFALSLLLATGDATFDQPAEAVTQARRYRDLESRSGSLTKPDLLDPRVDRFQSSTGEALFLSNHPEVQRLLVPSGNNLMTRLNAMKENREIVDTAVWTLLGRPAGTEERDYLLKFLDGHKDRSKACAQMVWALMTSAEFRFNH